VARLLLVAIAVGAAHCQSLLMATMGAAAMLLPQQGGQWVSRAGSAEAQHLLRLLLLLVMRMLLLPVLLLAAPCLKMTSLAAAVLRLSEPCLLLLQRGLPLLPGAAAGLVPRLWPAPGCPAACWPLGCAGCLGRPAQS
jgi:hypothetical protein